jgi:hypothetical protein
VVEAGHGEDVAATPAHQTTLHPHTPSTRDPAGRIKTNPGGLDFGQVSINTFFIILSCLCISYTHAHPNHTFSHIPPCFFDPELSPCRLNYRTRCGGTRRRDVQLPKPAPRDVSANGNGNDVGLGPRWHVLVHRHRSLSLGTFRVSETSGKRRFWRGKLDGTGYEIGGDETRDWVCRYVCAVRCVCVCGGSSWVHMVYGLWSVKFFISRTYVLSSNTLYCNSCSLDRE